MPGKGRGLRTLTGTLFQIAFLPIQFLSKLLSSSNSGRGVVTLMVAVKADVRLLLRGTTGMGRQLCALVVKAMELSRDRHQAVGASK